MKCDIQLHKRECCQIFRAVGRQLAAGGGLSYQMSSSEYDEVCASCGKAEADDVKLKICTACRLVKYCSVECQKNHRPKHKKACKKRMAEIRDDRLFQQPDESYLGECPICCLPLLLDLTKSRMMACCCKRICMGCNFGNKQREIELGLEQRCAFCREPVPFTREEEEKYENERVKANDPVALLQKGAKCQKEGDFEEAIQYLTKAAELGNMEAHYNLAILYQLGKGVEKNLKKKINHLEEAAIGGHPDARFNLGEDENENGRIDRAMKHFIIAAKLGHDKSLKAVKEGFAKGVISKEDYAGALRGHQAAVDETKSEKRAAAYEFTNSARLWAEASSDERVHRLEESRRLFFQSRR